MVAMWLALLVASFAQNQVREEPRDWKALRTEHFDLHYYDETILPRVKEYAYWFEEARARLAKKLGVEPPRINVFLYKSFLHMVQGSFLGRRCVLHRRAFAFAEPLQNRIVMHLQPSARWSQWFVEHELTHQFQFAAIFPWRLPSWLIYYKDPIIPEWFWEGFADYAAEIFDSDKEAYMRDLTAEGPYWLEDLFAEDTLNDYDAVAPYYEGSYFFKYLDETAPGGALRVFQEMAQGLPVFSVDYGEAGFRRWLARRAPKGGPPGDRLTDTRRYYRVHTQGGRFSPDGRKIACVTDLYTKPDVVVMDADGKNWRRVFGCRMLLDIQDLHSVPSWGDDRHVCVAGRWSNRDYVFIADVQGGTQSVLLPLDEVTDPALAPDGRTLAVSGFKDGRSDIYVYAEGRLTNLTNSDAHNFAPAWSPDQKSLAYITEEGGHHALMLWRDGKPTALTRSFSLLGHPQWSRDGARIYFEADHGGTWNIWSVELATGAFRKHTDVPLAARFASVSGERLLYTYFEGRGADLYAMRLVDAKPQEFSEPNRAGEFSRFAVRQQEGRRKDYDGPVKLDWLNFPVVPPFFPGVEASAEDLAGENVFTGRAFYLATGVWGSQAEYRLLRYRPTFAVNAEATALSADAREYGATFGIEYPLSPYLSVFAGYGARYLESNDPVDLDGLRRIFETGPSVGVRYRAGARRTLWDVAPGVFFDASAGFSDQFLGADRNVDRYSIGGGADVSLYQDHIVRLSMSLTKLARGPVDIELPRLRNLVRGGGVENSKGRNAFTSTVEYDFPIWRDILFKPFSIISLPQQLVLKDVKGFVFSDLGAASEESYDGMARDPALWTASVGGGLHIDVAFLFWPLIPVRVPLRIEVWGAFVPGPDRWDAGVGLGAEFSF